MPVLACGWAGTGGSNAFQIQGHAADRSARTRFVAARPGDIACEGEVDRANGLRAHDAVKRMTDAEAAGAPHCTTVQAARRLGMAVRSVQMMVDRGELVAWKTPGGHRRILRASIEACLADRSPAADTTPVASGTEAASAPFARAVSGLSKTASRVLLIEDSVHYQKLVSLLMARHFAGVDLHMADDGVAGLAMYGRLVPDILIIDILLPGIDGATLIMSLRSHPQFAGSDLVVITSLDEAARAPYAFALEGVAVVHKPRLVVDLPPFIERTLAARGAPGA